MVVAVGVSPFAGERPVTEHLNAQEAADYVGISRVELNRWARAGEIERIKVGNGYHYRADDLNACAMKRNVFNTACFVHEYTFFREQGMSHEVMAKRLGMSTELLISRAKRAGIYEPPRYEARAQQVLDRLIDSGEQFSADALPCLFDAPLAASLMAHAVADGRVRVAGKAKAKFTRSGVLLNVYEGVAA